MATHVICAVTGSVAGCATSGGGVNLGRGRAMTSREMQGGGVVGGVRIPEHSVAFVSPARSYSSKSHRADWRVFGDGRQCVESSAGPSGKNEVVVTDARLFSTIGGAPPQVLEHFQGHQWSKPAGDEGALLEAHEMALFSSSSDIIEDNMERLVEVLVSEEGRSGEDYRRRAVLFEKIAHFFSESRIYSTEQEESRRTPAEVARAMHIFADLILAEEGRSATDYNARAQFFWRSAELFPFDAAVRSV